MKKFDLCNEDLELLKEFKAEHKLRKEKARAEAKLSKKADPTWIQLMDNIGLEFTNFIGIRGYYNIADDRWVVVMTDVSRAHQLLRDAFDEIECVKIDRGFGWDEPINWVAFEISNRCNCVKVRDCYHNGEENIFMSNEKVDALEYKIREHVVPCVKECMYDAFPYQDRPRIIKSTGFDDANDIVSLYNFGNYNSPASGSFRMLTYKLKGMTSTENVIDFEEWLEND